MGNKFSKCFLLLLCLDTEGVIAVKVYHYEMKLFCSLDVDMTSPDLYFDSGGDPLLPGIQDQDNVVQACGRRYPPPLLPYCHQHRGID